MNKKLRLAISALCMSLLLVPLLPFSVPAEEEQPEEQTAQRDFTDYSVSGVGDLEALAELCRLDSASRNLRVTLKADIDLKDHENLMIPTFGGIFDGQNHKIYGIAIEQDGSARGLFRYIQQGATVKNLQLIGRVTPAGSSTQVGGLVPLLLDESKNVILDVGGNDTGAKLIVRLRFRSCPRQTPDPGRRALPWGHRTTAPR